MLNVHKIAYDKILSNKIEGTNPIKIAQAYLYSIPTCFEIGNYIECLYLDYNGYYQVILLDIESLETNFAEIIETQITNTDNLFSKCLYFKDNIVAFIYFINDNSSPKLLFKELVLPSDSDSNFYLNDFFPSIIINSDNIFTLDNQYFYNDLIKKDEKSLFYISKGKDSEKILIVLIRFINNYQGLLTFYYQINLNEYKIKIFTDFCCFIYNDHLGIGMTHYDYDKSTKNTYSSYFIIGNTLSYDVNIEDNIDIFDSDNIYEFKIENINIDIYNNIFGFYFYGIQIVSELNEETLGFNLYSNNKDKNLELNDIVLYDDIINFKIASSKGVKLGNYSIEYIPIISELKYEDLNSYFNLIEYFPDKDSDYSTYYNPETYELKKANILFTVNNCYKTCGKCSYYGNDISHKCEECSTYYPFYLIDDIENNFLNCYISCPDNYSNTDETNEYLCIKDNMDKGIDTTKDTEIDTIIDTTKDTEIDTIIDTTKDTVRDTTIETSKDTTIEASKDITIDTSKDITIDTSKDTTIDTSKDTTIDTSKDTTIDTSKDTTIDTALYSSYQNEEKSQESISSESLYCSENEFFPYEIIENQTCVKDCHAKDFFNQICKIAYNSIQTKDNLLETIRKEIKDPSMEDLLKNVTNENKKDLFIKAENVTYQITSSYNQNNKEYNISTIQLGICEDILKTKNKISPNDSLIILKVDYFIEGLYIPIIEYEIYNPYILEKLDLDDCINVDINISIPVSIDENELFKYNSSSEYYNDRCFSFKTNSGTDIILNDRKNEYNQNNMSLCEENCEYNGYNLTSKNVLCKCNIKKNTHNLLNINYNSDKLINKILDFKSNSNIEVVKCYRNLFTKEGILNNIGNYFVISIIIIFIISTILFWKKDYKSLFNIIYNIIKEKNKNKKSNAENKKIKIENKKNQNENQKSQKKDKKPKTDNKKSKKEDKSQNKVKNKNIKKNIMKTIKNHRNKQNYSNFPPKKSKNQYKNKINITTFKLSYSKLNINTKSNIFGKGKINLKTKVKERHTDTINKLILINKEIMKNRKYLDIELNLLPYKKALLYDKRTYCQYYYSLLKLNHLILSINSYNYNLLFIKICLLLFKFTLNLAVNALFFNDSSMHKIYEDEGKYDFIYELPKMIYSSLICGVVNCIITLFSSVQKAIIEIKEKKSIELSSLKVEKLHKGFAFKFLLFFSLSFIFLLLFWYYISCFCVVYQNTQIFLIEDSLISFSLSLIYPIFLCLFPGMLRIQSLKSSNGNNKNEFLYKVSKIVQLLL